MKKSLIMFFVALFVFGIFGSASAARAVKQQQLRKGSRFELVNKNGKPLWFVVNKDGSRSIADGDYKLSSGKIRNFKKGKKTKQGHKPSKKQDLEEEEGLQMKSKKGQKSKKGKGPSKKMGGQEEEEETLNSKGKKSKKDGDQKKKSRKTKKKKK